ncbi:hypothetical protein QQP08_021236 [Theobroma cacao]|nr:hypothetical protein QQP08_021236 [Theobroma cacao]
MLPVDPHGVMLITSYNASHSAEMVTCIITCCWNLDESSDEGNFPSWQDRALWVDLKPGNGMLEALMDAWGSYGQWMLNVVMGG